MTNRVGTMGRLVACIGFSCALLAAGGCSKQPPAMAAALVAPKVAQLHETPGELPQPAPASTAYLSVRLAIDEQGSFVLTHPDRPIKGATLNFDRARTARMTTPPPFWAFVINEQQDAVIYWVPVLDPRRVRVEPGGIIVRDRGVTTFRLPFEPDGWVLLVESDPQSRAPVAAMIQYPDNLSSGGSPGPTP